MPPNNVPSSKVPFQFQNPVLEVDQPMTLDDGINICKYMGRGQIFDADFETTSNLMKK